MAIGNYGDLKTAVANWLERDDLTERIPELIALGESRLFTQLRVREMEATAPLTTVAAQRTNSLPTRFVQARALYVSGTPYKRLEFRSMAEYWSIYASQTSAKPTVYTIVGENVVWGPVPDTAYTVTVDHYARPAALSSNTDTNAVLTRWPGLYLYPALLEAAPFLADDDRLVTWAGLYETLLDLAHASNLADRASGDVVSQTRIKQVS